VTEPEENEEKTPKTEAELSPRELRHPSTANPLRTRVPAEGIKNRPSEEERDELKRVEGEPAESSATPREEG
jgi:hypothetical protein